jgi:hypothetical protein
MKKSAEIDSQLMKKKQMVHTHTHTHARITRFDPHLFTLRRSMLLPVCCAKMSGGVVCLADCL